MLAYDRARLIVKEGLWHFAVAMALNACSSAAVAARYILIALIRRQRWLERSLWWSLIPP